MDPMIGQALGHYRIEATLGEGGMGVVYRAFDTHLDRPVAIKILRAGATASPEGKRRFVQEAKAASALNHPNIVHIYDISSCGGTDFIAMEFVAGKTLHQLIGTNDLPLRDTLKYAIQIADALARAHSAGIVHRDLKPANIIIDEDGRVKLLDFGLAKLTEKIVDSEAATATMTAEDGPLTEEGSIMGTVAYMSPEQAEGRKVDARSDIFSFGSVLYEMVTGRRPFEGATKMSTISAILQKEPPPPSGLAPNLPAEFEKIILRCLRKDRDRRTQHVDDIKLALEELRDDSASGKRSLASKGSDQTPAGDSDSIKTAKPEEPPALVRKLFGSAAPKPYRLWEILHIKIPAAVGVDIGCGMMAVKTSLHTNHLPDNLYGIRTAIEKAVPHGRTDNGGKNDRGAWSDAPAHHAEVWAKMDPAYQAIIDKYPKLNHVQRINHLGTLGTGNHFIEVCLDENENVWFLLHSGSRGVGNRFGTFFIELAKNDMRQWMINLPDKDLAYQQRKEAADLYVEAYRRYCWTVHSLADLKLAPFHLLASEGAVHSAKDHLWHMGILARMCQADIGLLLATPFQVVDLTDRADQEKGIKWWEELTASGGEGMVVKPLEFVAKGRKGLVQPAVKVRGREYLRIIYGPEYTFPENLLRLKSRGLGAKRSLALREFALGLEALERFVHQEPLRRVHECVFGVLALESEPVDPRL